jgi:hypothetical protein
MAADRSASSMPPLVSCLLLAALFASWPASAGPDSPTTPLPSWLTAKINEFSRLPVTNPPRSVLQVTYRGKPVYFIPPQCCDIPSELYDADGNLLCYPSGGFAGGDGRCPGFALSGQRVTRIWSDRRAEPGVAGETAPRMDRK